MKLTSVTIKATIAIRVYWISGSVGSIMEDGVTGRYFL